MILVSRGKGTEARVLPQIASRAKVFDILVPGAGSRVPGTRQLGARYGGIVVTSTESVDFWYRYVGTVVTSTEIVDLGYPKYRDSYAFGTPKRDL